MAIPATQPMTAFTEEQATDAVVAFTEQQTTDAEDANAVTVKQVADAEAIVFSTLNKTIDVDAADAFTIEQAAAFSQEQTSDADNASTFTVEKAADVDFDISEVDMHRLLLSAGRGDWVTAKKIFESEPNVRTRVASTIQGLEILDTAVICGQWEYFNELLQVMNAQTLAIQYERRNRTVTILDRVARVYGRMKSAKALVEKCPSLTQITDSNGCTPLFNAIIYSIDKDLAWYLAFVTTDEDPGRPFSGPRAADLLCGLLGLGYYDITHYLLQRHPHLADILLTAKTARGNIAFKELALQPSDFPSGTKLGWLARCIYPFVYVEVDHFQPPSHVQQEFGRCSSSSINHQLGLQRFQKLLWNAMGKLVPGLQRIRDTKFKQECAIKLVYIACEKTKWGPKFDKDPVFDDVISKTLKAAVEFGISEILSIYMTIFPLSLDDIAHTSLMDDAIEYRQDKVFNLFLRNYPKSVLEFYMNEAHMNSLHLAAKLKYCPKITSIAGVAFQMQHELQWFKGIEKLVSHYSKHEFVGNHMAWDLFIEEHETMRKEGEKWMKDTSNSCMLVATLIATVVFAAAFTVPGGNNQENGTPIFLQSNTFLLFAVFDALALFSSINSLGMFLSILTTRFAFEDFLETLPKRLIFGLATLFLAIVSSITAFGAAFSLVLGYRQNVLMLLIVLMALISVAMFTILQLPLFIEMVRSTYCRRLIGS